MAAIHNGYSAPRRSLSAIVSSTFTAASRITAAHGDLVISGLLAAAFIAGGAGPWFETARDFFGRHDPFWVREDFTAFYAAGALVRQGLTAHLYDPATIAHAEYAAAGRQVGGSGVLYYFNPPFFAWLMSPLTNLSLQHAYEVWTLGSLALLALNCWLLLRLAASLSRRARVLLVLGYLTLYPLTFGLRLGQFSLVLQASWAAGALLLARDRDRLAGLAFAPLLIKPELALPVLLFLALKRAWAAVAALSAVAVVAVLISIALVGLPAALHYPGFVLNSTAANGNGVAPDLMINWSGMLAATFGHGASVGRAIAAALLSAATFAALIPFLHRPTRRADARFAAQWLAITVAALLCDPHLYLQDTIIAVPAAAAVLATAPETCRLPIGAILVMGWGVERLALHPNQVWHANLFAMHLALTLALVIGASQMRWPLLPAPAHDTRPVAARARRAARTPAVQQSET